MKKHSKIIILALIFALALSVCSCSLVKSVTRDAKRINQFKDKVMGLSNISNPEEAEAKIEELIHPDSDLTKEIIINKAKADPDLEGIDIEAILKEGYSIGNFSDYKLQFNDSKLGGNIYQLTIEVITREMTFIIHLRILSDDTGIGLYDFDISVK